MKYRPVLALLAAVTVAAIVAYVLSRALTSQELDEQRRRLMPGLSTDEVARVEIETDGRKIVCERSPADPAQWLITAPLELRADGLAVEGIIDGFAAAERVLKPISPRGGEALALSDFGLDSPRRRATFRQADAAGAGAWSILIGDPTGVADHVYAALPGADVVYRIGGDLADRLDVTLNDLRSKKLCPPISEPELTGVQVTASGWGGEGGFHLVCRRTEGRWELREPVLDAADAGVLEALARAVNGHVARPQDFMSDDSAGAGRCGLDDPALSLTFDAAGKARTILLGRTPDGEQERFYAMSEGEPSIVEVPRSLFAALRKSPAEVRSRSLLDFDVRAARKVSVAGPQGRVDLERVGGSWRIAGDAPAAADELAVSDLLAGLGGARVAQFVEESPSGLVHYGLDEGRRREVSVIGEDGEAPASVQLGSDTPDGSRVYARRPPYPAVLSVDRAAFIGAVRGGRLALLDRLVCREPAERSVGLSLARGRESFRCERASPEDDWRLVKPVTSLADQEAVAGMIGALAALRASGFAAETAQDLVPYGLEEPAITLAVTYRRPKPQADNAETNAGGPTEPEHTTYDRRLLVGGESKQEPAGFFAKLDSRPGVFILPAHLVARLDVNPASKLLFRAQGIERLAFTLQDGSRTFLFDREAGAWKDDEGAELGEEARGRLASAARLLSDFTAVRVAAYTESDPITYGFDTPALKVEIKDRTSGGNLITIGGEAPGGGRYAKGPATGFVLVVGDVHAETLLAAARPAGDAAPAESER